jgi:hypothetical protein
MEPSAFRRALRQPMPAAERDYLAAQFVGEQQPALLYSCADSRHVGEVVSTIRLQADTPQKQGIVWLS